MRWLRLAWLAWAGCAEMTAPQQPPPLVNVYPSLTVSPLKAQERSTVSFFGAVPGASVEVYGSNTGLGAGPCVGQHCIELDQPQLLFTGTADANGRARWQTPILPRLEPTEWWFQGLATGAAGGTTTIIRKTYGGRCTPDRFEPNSHPDQARPIEPGVYRSLQACRGDVDRFLVQVPAGQTVRIQRRMVDRMEPLTESQLGEVQITTPTGVFEYANSLQWGNSGPDTAEVELAIQRLGGIEEERYDLVVELVTPGECTSSGGGPLPFGEPLRGRVCGNDVHIYSLTADQAARVTVVNQTSVVDGDVELELIGPTESTTHWRWVTGEATTGQTWELRVTQRGDDSTQDGVEYELFAFLFEGGCQNDDREPDDVTPTPLTPGLTRGILCPGDLDQFSFDLLGYQRATYQIATPRVDTPLTITETVPGQWAGANVIADRLRLVVPTQPTSCLLQVQDDIEPEQLVGVPYNLFFEVDDPCIDDPFEPDNITMRQGDTVVRTMCRGDIDRFNIYVGSGEGVVFSVRATDESRHEFALQIRNATGPVHRYDATDGVQHIYYRPSTPELVSLRVTDLSNYQAYSVHAAIARDEPCRDDQLGNSNGPPSAISVDVDGDIRAVACINTDDWYRIDPVGGENLVVSLEVLHPPLEQVTVALTTATGLLVAESVHGSIRVEDLAPEPHFLSVRGVSDGPSGGGIPYDLHVEVIERLPCVEDAFAPNHDVSTAAPLTWGRFAATACEGAVDVYSFDANDGDGVILTIDQAVEDDELFTVTFREPTGAIRSVLTSFNRYYYYPQVDGTHTVHIEYTSPSLYRSAHAYTMEFRGNPSWHCEHEATEPNNSTSYATPLQGVATANACLHDEDWFSVELVEGDLFTAELTYDNSAGEQLELELRTPDGTLLARSLDPTVSARAETAGSHQVVVTSFEDDMSGLGTTYDLEVHVQPLGSCAVDVLEPDNIPELGNPLGLGETITATTCIGNDDWFQVNAPGPVWIAGPDGLELFDGDVLLPGAEYDGASASLDIRVSTPEGPLLDPGTPYTLSAWSLYPCVVDRHEPDNLRSQARDAAPGDVLSGDACRGDEDWVRIVVPDGQTLTPTPSYDFFDFELVAYELGQPNPVIRAFGPPWPSYTASGQDRTVYIQVKGPPLWRHSIDFGVRYTLDLQVQ